MRARIIDILEHCEVLCKNLKERKQFVQFIKSHDIKVDYSTEKPCLACDKKDMEMYPYISWDMTNVVTQSSHPNEDLEVVTIDKVYDLLDMDQSEMPWESQFPRLAGYDPEVADNGKSVTYGCKTIKKEEAEQLFKLMDKFGIFCLDVEGGAPVEVATVEDLVGAFKDFKPKKPATRRAKK